MASVVFLRGANVGGSKVFSPSRVARALADLDVASLGAAGTFVVRKPASAAALRARFREALPIEADVMVRPGKEVAALVARDPFAQLERARGAAGFVSVLGATPRLKLMPIAAPADRGWTVKVLRLDGAYALSLRRRVAGRALYPNEVVERALGVRATTRAWGTFEALARALAAA